MDSSDKEQQWKELNMFWARNDIARRLKCWEADGEGVICVPEYSCKREEIFSEMQLGGTQSAALGWPPKKPASDKQTKAGAADKAMIKKILSEKSTKVILELGASSGGRCAVFCKKAPKAQIYSSDLWQESGMHESFVANLWDQRSQVVPMKMLTVEAIKMIRGAELKPGLVYMVPDLYVPAQMTLELCLSQFPSASVVGGGWDQEEVRKAVVECRERKAVHVQDNKSWSYVDISSGSSTVSIEPDAKAASMTLCNVHYHFSGRVTDDVARYMVLADLIECWDNIQQFELYVDKLGFTTKCAQAYGRSQHDGKCSILCELYLRYQLTSRCNRSHWPIVNARRCCKRTVAYFDQDGERV
jgi:hypothetical protein